MEDERAIPKLHRAAAREDGRALGIPVEDAIERDRAVRAGPMGPTENLGGNGMSAPYHVWHPRSYPSPLASSSSRLTWDDWVYTSHG